MPPSAGRIRQLIADGARAMVPRLWHYEMANSLAIAERRSILTHIDLDRAVSNIEQLITASVDTDSSFPSLRHLLVTAKKFQLTAYDAAYLDLARRENLPLATLDERLRQACRQAGVVLSI